MHAEWTRECWRAFLSTSCDLLAESELPRDLGSQKCIGNHRSWWFGRWDKQGRDLITRSHIRAEMIENLHRGIECLQALIMRSLKDATMKKSRLKKFKRNHTKLVGNLLV